jgi:hypothetical protein
VWEDTLSKEQIDPIEQVTMLDDVARQIGYAVWDLQELEWMLGRLWVLTRPDIRGAGPEVAAPVLERADKRTFGTAFRELIGAGLFDSDLAARLGEIVDERNWIVHRSRRDNRGIVNSRARCAAFLARLERAQEESAELRELVFALVTRETAAVGTQQDVVDRQADRLLQEWGFGE